MMGENVKLQTQKWKVQKEKDGNEGTDIIWVSEVEQTSVIHPLVFSTAKTNAQVDDDSSIVVIKPHLVRDGKCGQVLSIIAQEGFVITALQLFHLTQEQMLDFMSAYEGVLKEYKQIVSHMVSGPIVVVEIHGKRLDDQNNGNDINVPNVQQLRELVGPFDPPIAKFLRPDTIRSKFGIDFIQNAVHCTDLPDDGPLDVEFFFLFFELCLSTPFFLPTFKYVHFH
ncbi:hypothetical protein RFI_07910 [Reticulomyxa filosa]|uniref:Nucleoside diphosphate kinase-like domain-containing protein n=1 Tax=Reticulomyxa filosa TaxID=46433 RepID=X6NT80_RETFI|nr:hypothetical protein RFI_07910 [Reticulomyxa filosa]|eukprot:ETO29216.1 hypothetical protein RFI_07910 [Reticulomyxa filosa]